MTERRTINDVYTLVARVEERQINLVDKFNKSEEKDLLWKEGHEKKDEERFNGLNKYGTSIAIVAGAIGAGGMIIFKIMGLL